MFSGAPEATLRRRVDEIPKRRDVPENDDAGSIKARSTILGPPLEGKDLTSAVLELNSYLAGTRARLQRVLDPVSGKLKPPATSKTPEEAMRSFLVSTGDGSEKEA